MVQYLRAEMAQGEGEQTEGRPIRFIASTPGVKRDGKSLEMAGWNLDNYRRNPVFLWAHNYGMFSNMLPIGRADVTAEPERLMADVTFDQEDEFARAVESKYRRGFLHAVSVGWEEREVDGKIENELLDISAVPVPADPDALIERQIAGMRRMLEEWGREGAPTPASPARGRGERPYPNEHACRLRDPGQFQEDTFRRVSREHEGKRYDVIMGRLKGEDTMTEQAYRYPRETWTAGEARTHCASHDGNFEAASGEEGASPHGTRGAHPPHSTPKAPEEAAWDGPREVAKAEGAEQLWRMHAWRDDDMDPELKQAYKLPHHLVSGEVVWRGVAAAMVRLLQAGTQIPDGDRRGVYNHLARHYEQFDKEPPEFRSIAELEALTPELWRGLFVSGEFDDNPDPDLVVVLRILSQK